MNRKRTNILFTAQVFIQFYSVIKIAVLNVKMKMFPYIAQNGGDVFPWTIIASTKPLQVERANPQGDLSQSC
jgi:hypothetical protein